MRRQRVQTSYVESGQWMYNHQSLSAASSQDKPIQFIFPDRTTCIGIPITNESTSSTDDTEDIYVVCSPSNNSTDFNLKSLMTSLILIQCLCVSLIDSIPQEWRFTNNSTYSVVGLSAHSFLLLYFLFRSPNILAIYKISLIIATSIQLLIGFCNWIEVFLLMINLPIFYCADYIYKNIEDQVFLSSARQIQ